MQLKETMTTLKKLGSPQTVKTWQRHGAGENLFGVKVGDLSKLQKKIKVDHDLAQQLWKTGNADAQTLALMVADPQQMKASVADTWLREISWKMLLHYLAELIARSPIAKSRLTKWTKSKKETTRTCGYTLLATLLRDSSDELTDKDCRAYLKTIESEIHSSANQARLAMNGALCAIGIYCDDLCEEAQAAARRIGKVEVDHGDTSCKTPDAESYIQKAVKRRR